MGYQYPTDDRPICARCYNAVAKRGRQICNNCYRAQAWQNRMSQDERLEIHRPPRVKLQDTGLRIDCENNELIYPDGRRHYPAPKIVVGRDWMETEKSNDNVLRILRPRPRRKAS